MIINSYDQGAIPGDLPPMIRVVIVTLRLCNASSVLTILAACNFVYGWELGDLFAPVRRSNGARRVPRGEEEYRG